MKIKLVDHKIEGEEALWGTCELCSHTGWFDFTYLKFQADDGSEPYWTAAFEYDWSGPRGVEVGNLFDFAAWLSEQEFYPGDQIDYDRLVVLVDRYCEEKHG